MCAETTANEFWAIVPGKAKSAATMICFGASKILMGVSSELGPIDPQLTITDESGQEKRYSLFSIVKSYQSLFANALKAKGNLQPYLQLQLLPDSFQHPMHPGNGSERDQAHLDTEGATCSVEDYMRRQTAYEGHQ